VSSRGHELPSGLAREVQDQLGRLGPPTGAPLAGIVSAWPAAVGVGIAANAWPVRVTRDGVLIVHTSASVWAQELSQLEEDIRARLGREAPKRLRFVVGPVPEAGAEDGTRAQHSVDSPTAAERETACQIARTIRDPELRALVADAAAHSLAAARRRGPTGASGML
jgi:hypothetical protein